MDSVDQWSVCSKEFPVLLEGDADELATGSDARLGKKLLHRVFDGTLRNAQADGYLFVG